MHTKDLKYLIAFTLPIIGIIGLKVGNNFVWAGFIYAFVFIPGVELFLKGNKSNQEVGDEERKKSIFFDFLLFLNIPIVFGTLSLALLTWSAFDLSLGQQIGIILTSGTILGSSGINVAHELGHRSDLLSKIGTKLLLIPSFYTHFTIEHNRGHHKFVATPLDPATAKKNEIVYFFWFRSTIIGYMNAWKLESKRLAKKSHGSQIFDNEMVWNTILQLVYAALLLALGGLTFLLVGIAIGTVSVLLLETINYVEHYGLQRKITKSGNYEMATMKHSWNSEHALGRILLYELTRHSDHHYKTNKKYQTLEYYEESPQLPVGYPGSIILSLVPPLWFKVMNDKIPA